MRQALNQGPVHAIRGATRSSVVRERQDELCASTICPGATASPTTEASGLSSGRSGKSVQLRPPSRVSAAVTLPSGRWSRIRASQCPSLTGNKVGCGHACAVTGAPCPEKSPWASKRKATGYLIPSSKCTGKTMPPSCSAMGGARTKKLVFQSHDKGKGRSTSNALVSKVDKAVRWRR